MTPAKRNARGTETSKQKILLAAHEEMRRFKLERRQSLRRARGLDRSTLLMIAAIILLLCGLVVDITYHRHTQDPATIPDAAQR